MEAALQASAPRKQHQPRAAGTEAFMSQEMAHLPNYPPTPSLPPQTHTHTHACTPQTHPFHTVHQTSKHHRFLLGGFSFAICLSHMSDLLFFFYSGRQLHDKSVYDERNGCILNCVTLILAHFYHIIVEKQNMKIASELCSTYLHTKFFGEFKDGQFDNYNLPLLLPPTLKALDSLKNTHA